MSFRKVLCLAALVAAADHGRRGEANILLGGEINAEMGTIRFSSPYYTPDRNDRLVWPSSDSQGPALVVPSS